MAKKKATDEGLPYFKFFISKWSTGNIQQCSLSSQGLFMNLCVLYWGQRGDLYLSKMKKRFQRKLKMFEELISENVIKLNGDKIEITFLDEQLQELGFVSEKNRENANKRWNQRKSDATASIPQSDGNANAMPIEEKREEEIRKEESEIRAHVEFVPGPKKNALDFSIVLPDKSELFEEIFSDEQFTEGLARSYPGLDYSKCWEACWRHHSVKPVPPEHAWQWKQKLGTWLEIELRKNERAKTGTKQRQNTNDLAKGWAERHSNGNRPEG